MLRQPGKISLLSPSFVRLAGALALPALPAGVGANFATGAEPVASARWKVDRLADARGPLALPTDVQQQIAAHLGIGHYVVTDCLHTFVNDDRTARAQVLYIYGSAQAQAEHRPPLGRALVTGNTMRWFEAGDDTALVSAALKTLPAPCPDDATLQTLVRDAVALALTGEAGTPAVTATSLTRQKDGNWSWQGTTGREHLVIREVSGPEAGYEMDRTPDTSAAIKAFATSDDNGEFRIEQWEVDNTPAWIPTKRYQVRLALAALRPDPVKNYQLAVELLADPAPGAQAQGLRLLKETAATGYLDAQRLLARIESGDNHPAAQREQSRPER